MNYSRTSAKTLADRYRSLPPSAIPLRFVFAIFRSSVSLIDLAIWLDAPLSDDLERLPRFAASAAPAAICCFFDFAGIHKIIRAPRLNRTGMSCAAQPP